MAYNNITRSIRGLGNSSFGPKANIKSGRFTGSVRQGRTSKSAANRRGDEEDGMEGNAVANARLQAIGTGAAQEELAKEQARQAAIQTKAMQQDYLTQLGQQSRGTSQGQMEEQQRRIAMEEQRERQRARSTFNVIGQVNERFGRDAKEGRMQLSKQETAELRNMVPGYEHKFDDKGNLVPPIIQLEDDKVAFYHKSDDGTLLEPITTEDGFPVKIGTNVWEQAAKYYKFDRDERSGIPGRARQARAEEAQIDLAGAQAEKARGEAQYARMGKPTATSTGLTDAQRSKAVLDNRKAYNDVLAAIDQAVMMNDGQPLPPEHPLMTLMDDLETTVMDLQGGGTGVIPPGGGQAIPTQQAPAPEPQQARPRAQNPQTGEIIEWDGSQWVPV